MSRAILFSATILLLAFSTVRAEEAATISEARKDADGFLVHEVQSPYQAGTTLIRVLVPDGLEQDEKLPVIYVLPVEAGTESRYGDGLKEVAKLGLHDKFDAIFVAPTFSHLPWYADHPTDRALRQESHFVDVVVPFVDETYPVQAEPDGRLLLGFSKSGWGAWSLALRRPDLFGKAVAWDAPLTMDGPGKYGSGAIFGTKENFQSYRVSELLARSAERLRKEQRLLLLGYGNFRDEHQRTHAQLATLEIPHEYRDGPSRKHDWHSGWVEEAVELLLERP